MKKLVIVMNGSGGVGKDTLCDIAAKSLKTRSISSVDPIKALARQGGWQGEKDDNGRLLLVRLKQAFVDYNDLPLKYLLSEVEKFRKDDTSILFVHIREPQEIEKFKVAVGDMCKTILVQRDTGITWHNSVDSGVNNYTYDHIFHNDAPIELSGKQFVSLLTSMLESTK
jgi:hypothetical protein